MTEDERMKKEAAGAAETVYFACKYVPTEIFEGFGAECRRLDPVPANFDCADACAHPNLCGFGKGIIEAVHAEPVKVLIITDCCDVMRRVYDVLKQEGLVDFIYFLPFPHKSGENEVRVFERSLRRLAAAWSEYSGAAFDWKKAFDAWERGRKQAAEAEVKGEHISVSGAHAGDLLMRSITSRFDMPVTDDTCSGNRSLTPPIGAVTDEDTFFLYYAAGLLRQERPCMRMLDRHGNDFPENAKGIVLHTVKFCDYYSFYYHDVRQHRDVPLLKIETDGTEQSRGQMATRLDAFAETLHVRRKEGIKMKGKINMAAGVDSGSTSTDAVVMDADGKILGSAIVPTGTGAAKAAEEALEEALRQAGIGRDDLDALVTTGYGRETTGLSDDDSVTEITCHARGAHFLYPAARTVIDIGGQDSKVIRIDEEGHVLNFVMNDKCAAGTGRFLDMMARTLHMDLEELSREGLEWKNDVTISSMCTVFAESEVVSLVADNTAPQDIIHGLNKAVAGKTVSLTRRLGGEPEYIMTGGVAQNRGVVAALEEKLGAEVHVPEDAQLCGAIGAALIAIGK
jgi:predicted CoA-substrate-specific enzyme activase